MHYDLSPDLAIYHVLVDPNEPRNTDDSIKAYECISPEVASERSAALRRDGSDLRWVKDPAGP